MPNNVTESFIERITSSHAKYAKPEAALQNSVDQSLRNILNVVIPKKPEAKKQKPPKNVVTLLPPQRNGFRLDPPNNSFSEAEEEMNIRVRSVSSARPSLKEGPILLGLEGLHRNVGIVFYNPRTHKAVAANQKTFSAGKIKEYLQLARVEGTDVQPNDKIEVHVVGRPWSSIPDKADMESLTRMTSEGQDIAAMFPHSKNARRFLEMRTLYENLSADPHVDIRTFDVLDKLKPHAFAVDLRNGQLVEGSSKFCRFSQDAKNDLIENGTDFKDYMQQEPYPPQRRSATSGEYTAMLARENEPALEGTGKSGGGQGRG